MVLGVIVTVLHLLYNVAGVPFIHSSGVITTLMNSACYCDSVGGGLINFFFQIQPLERLGFKLFCFTIHTTMELNISDKILNV